MPNKVLNFSAQQTLTLMCCGVIPSLSELHICSTKLFLTVSEVSEFKCFYFIIIKLGYTGCTTWISRETADSYCVIKYRTRSVHERCRTYIATIYRLSFFPAVLMTLYMLGFKVLKLFCTFLYALFLWVNSWLMLFFFSYEEFDVCWGCSTVSTSYSG